MPRALIAETIDLIAVLSGRGDRRRLDRTRRRRGPCAQRRLSRSHTLWENHDDPLSCSRTRRHCGSRYRSLLSVSFAPAAYAAGSGMPWEQPLQQILQSVEGPVAKIMAVIIIIITGLTLAFGDTSGGFRRLIQIVFGLSIAFAASSFFLSFFSFGGGALI